MFSALAAPHTVEYGGAVSASSSLASSQPVAPWPDKAYRAAQRSAKYQAVLTTAARLFCERGFHAAALDDVALRLQVSKPTLYYYVRSKKALIEASAQQGQQNALQAIEAAAVEGGRGSRLQRCLTAYAQSVATDFGWCMVRAYEYAHSAGAVHQELANRLAALCPELRDADEAAMWLLAIDGIACTGGRRSMETVLFHVERMLSVMGSSLGATETVSRTEPFVEVPEILTEVLAASAVASSDAAPAHRPVVSAEVPAEVVTVEPNTAVVMAEKKPKQSPVPAAKAKPVQVKEAAVRKSQRIQAESRVVERAPEKVVPLKTSQFSLF